MAFFMRQPPFWSLKERGLIKAAALLPAQGCGLLGLEPLAAPLPPGRGARRGAPGAVRQGRGAERRRPGAGGIAASSPGFFGVSAVVAHQVVIGGRFTVTVVVVVVFMGYFVDSITLLE